MLIMNMRMKLMHLFNESRPALVSCRPLGYLIINSIPQNNGKSKRKHIRVVVFSPKGKKLSTAKVSNVTENAKCNGITADYNFFKILIVKFVITVKVLHFSLFCYFGVMTPFPKTAACQKLCQYNRKPHNSKPQLCFFSLGAQMETCLTLKTVFKEVSYEKTNH